MVILFFQNSYWFGISVYFLQYFCLCSWQSMYMCCLFWLSRYQGLQINIEHLLCYIFDIDFALSLCWQSLSHLISRAWWSLWEETSWSLNNNFNVNVPAWVRWQPVDWKLGFTLEGYPAFTSCSIITQTHELNNNTLMLLWGFLFRSLGYKLMTNFRTIWFWIFMDCTSCLMTPCRLVHLCNYHRLSQP